MILGNSCLYLSGVCLFLNQLASIFDLNEKVDGNSYGGRLRRSYTEREVKGLLCAWGETVGQDASFVISPYFLTIHNDFLDADGELG